MASYFTCEKLYASRKKGRDYKVLSHNQILLYDERENCYLHKHHNTITVRIYPDRFVLNTGGWDTVTTWKKMHEYAVFSRSGPPSKSVVGSHFVRWTEMFSSEVELRQRVFYTEFYDGIEVSHAGVPLLHCRRPLRVRRLRKGFNDEFYALARSVYSRLALRVALGEFDVPEHTGQAESVSGRELLELLYEANKYEGFLPHEFVAPLFARRPRQAFGRPTASTYFGSPARTGAELWRTSINTALQEFARWKGDPYEIVSLESNQWPPTRK